MDDQSPKEVVPAPNEKEKDQSSKVFIPNGAYRPKEYAGVSHEFRRIAYDNVAKRNEFKSESFQEKRTAVDFYTGNVLHKDTNAAIRKYGKAKYTGHAADVDHTVPLKTVYERNKANPFLSDQDIKKSGISKATIE